MENSGELENNRDPPASTVARASLMLMATATRFDQVIVLDQFALESVSPQKLTRIDKLVLGAVDGTRTVNDIIKESAVSSFDAIKCVYQFLQSRVLRPRAA